MTTSFVSPRAFARWFVSVACLCGLLLCGCGPSGPATGTVEGKVLLNDAPYADAAVVFISLKTGTAGTADLQPGGTFKLKDPLRVGEYQVFLSPKVVPGGEPKPVSIDTAVPDKYWNESTTDIVLEVKAGKNDFTVPLKK